MIYLILAFYQKCAQIYTFFLSSSQDRGQKITEGMRQLEKEMMKEMEKILQEGIEEPDLLVNLFSTSVKEEMSVYSK